MTLMVNKNELFDVIGLVRRRLAIFLGFLSEVRQKQIESEVVDAYPGEPGPIQLLRNGAMETCIMRSNLDKKPHQHSYGIVE